MLLIIVSIILFILIFIGMFFVEKDSKAIYKETLLDFRKIEEGDTVITVYNEKGIVESINHLQNTLTITLLSDNNEKIIDISLVKSFTKD